MTPKELEDRLNGGTRALPYFNAAELGMCPRVLAQRHGRAISGQERPYSKDRMSELLKHDTVGVMKSMVSNFTPVEGNVTELPFYGWLDGIVNGSTGILIRTVALDTHLSAVSIPMSWQFNAQALMLWRPDLTKVWVIGVSRYSGLHRIHEVARHQHIIQRIAEKVAELQKFVSDGTLPACSCGRCS